MNNIIFTRDIRADLQLKLADFGIADIFVLVDNNSVIFVREVSRISVFLKNILLQFLKVNITNL